MAELTPRTAPGWYQTTLEPRDARAGLAGERTTDVAIIGGGLAGLAVAQELLKRGVGVIVLEAERVGFGASGRNGGFVSPGFALGLGGIDRRLGRAAADALYRLSLDGVEIVRRNVSTVAPASLLGRGILSVRRIPDAEGVAADQRHMADRFARRLQRLDPAGTRQLAKSSRYHDGLLDEASFHINPLTYVEALASEIERLGGIICEGSRAISVTTAPGSIIVASGSGRVRCRHVVHATSAYDRQLERRLARAIQPIATYMLATVPLGDVAKAAIATEVAIADDRRAGDYYRCLADGRILWGGRITTRTSEPAKLAALLAADMRAVYPQLGNPPVAHAWSGLMAYARHKMPLIGRFSQTEWYSTGFGGHGLNTTAMAGELIASAIANGDQRYLQFAPYAAEWAGSVAGKIAVQLTYWAMQGRDWMDEARARN